LLDRIRKTIPAWPPAHSFIVGFPAKPDRTFRELAASCSGRSLMDGRVPYSDVDNASSFALDEKS